MSKSVLTPQAQDFPQWYQDVVATADLAENGPVRGTMIIKPYAYAMWERIQAKLDESIKDQGALNAYFPLFIPESYLSKEAEHVDGFSPELAVVTHAGGSQLEEPAVVRPTSETIIGESMAKWIQSYRDLPMVLNQWANVVRWEMRPRLFLRSSEFLWQEGHTAHATKAEASDFTRAILDDVYVDFLENEMALPVARGLKTARERFAGATHTWTCETMMSDGKALQSATSHELGQNFSRAFGMDFHTADGSRELAWTTSWGASTRLLGALIMGHGDDKGLRVPPRLAPVQVEIIMVKNTPEVVTAASTLYDELEARGLRVVLNDRTDLPFGRRAVQSEVRGVPVRIDVGPRDLEQGQVSVVRRAQDSSEPVPLSHATLSVVAAIDADQSELWDQALQRRDERTADVATLDQVREQAATGWARIPWRTLGEAGEAELAGDGITVRCLTLPDYTAPDDDTDEDLLAIVARAY